MRHKTVENVERVDQTEVEIQGIQGRSQAPGSSNAHARHSHSDMKTTLDDSLLFWGQMHRDVRYGQDMNWGGAQDPHK